MPANGRNRRTLVDLQVTTVFPSGLASAPVLAKQGDEEFPLRFIGGLFGVGQDPVTRTVAPQIGWAVVHEAAADVRALSPVS